MKKTLLSVMALAGALAMNAQNPFAYGLKGEIQDKVLTVTYSLNTAAETVDLQILKDGGVVKTIERLETAKGEHETVVDLSDFLDGEYTWQIAVTGGATSGNPVNFSTLSFYHPCGLDVDNSFESPSFGTIFVAEGYTDGKKSGYISAQADGSEGSGLYMLTPTLESILNKDNGKRFYPSFLTHSHQYSTKTSAGADFSKVAVADDGRIFVSRHNNLGDYILSAPSVADLVENGEFTSLVDGKTMDDSTTTYNDANGAFLLGPVQSMDVKGSGENTKIIALTRNANNIEYAIAQNRVKEYYIGTGDALEIANAYPVLDGKFTISYDRGANVVYDNRGGVWYCQYRSTPSNSEPALVYVDANGNQKYFEGVGGKVRNKAAIAISPDGKKLAVSRDYKAKSSNYMAIYDISYSEDGTVSLTEVTNIKFTFTSSSDNLMSATWDVVGNLYLGNPTREWVKGYAVPRANNTFATKAATKYGFTVNGDTVTDIDAVEVDANAPVEYYNLQGVKVENPTKGIFIKKQGAKAIKVIL